jgi:hypothetical protein
MDIGSFLNSRVKHVAASFAPNRKELPSPSRVITYCSDEASERLAVPSSSEEKFVRSTTLRLLGLRYPEELSDGISIVKPKITTGQRIPTIATASWASTTVRIKKHATPPLGQRFFPLDHQLIFIEVRGAGELFLQP